MNTGRDEYLAACLSRYRTRGLLVDSNLLLVYCIGKYDRDRIPNFKRTRAYTIEDYELLERFAGSFATVVTTPHILAEVNALSNQLPNELKLDYFSEFARQIRVLEERYSPSRSISLSPQFRSFGLTDSGIIELVKDEYLVLTDDLSLARCMWNVGIDVINFNHIRTIFWEY